MKRLSELLSATAVVQFVTAADPEIGALEYDSRKVKAGDWQYITDKCKEALGYCAEARK